MRRAGPNASNIAQKQDDDDFIGVIKIGHNQYIHILDKNSNTTRLVEAVISIKSDLQF